MHPEVHRINGEDRNVTIADIRQRLADCRIPIDAQADWDGTNHFEIGVWTADNANDIWWLEADPACVFRSNTEEGKRLGAVLDYAVAYRRDVGYLLNMIAGLMTERPNELQPDSR